MKNALILHGAGNTSQGNWFPWLKGELEKKGYIVWSPDMPNADVPDQQKWLETIFSNKDWVFDAESIIIGHSAGATLTLRILEQLPPNVKIKQAITVATFLDKGSIPDYFPYKESLVSKQFEWGKIKSSCEKLTFVASDNDQYDCGERHAKVLHEHLGGELIIQTGQGHFNLETGYKEFPLLLKLID